MFFRSYTTFKLFEAVQFLGTLFMMYLLLYHFWTSLQQPSAYLLNDRSDNVEGKEGLFISGVVHSCKVSVSFFNESLELCKSGGI